MTKSELARALRLASHRRYIQDLREGRKQRSTFIPARKGKGSYSRRNKYKDVEHS